MGASIGWAFSHLFPLNVRMCGSVSFPHFPAHGTDGRKKRASAPRWDGLFGAPAFERFFILFFSFLLGTCTRLLFSSKASAVGRGIREEPNRMA
ncbi:hypothetical protein K432DRAFT_380179 [Lepidopterella palustris CBS 459.81]|uniref:Uncharacterized protein n=1 Tax=Lepidopterella palustris CBS 459.81 TaxID=1314670 RepID=A0A8E2JHP1_9PEZI|nr:hypothetical protein K432DRAFT_380179 [Lepidopterella palustris CBS 459.81]